MGECAVRGVWVFGYIAMSSNKGFGCWLGMAKEPGFGYIAMSSNMGLGCLLGMADKSQGWWLKSQGWCPCNHSKWLKRQERRWVASPSTHSIERGLLAEKQTHIYHFGEGSFCLWFKKATIL